MKVVVHYEKVLVAERHYAKREKAGRALCRFLIYATLTIFSVSYDDVASQERSEDCTLNEVTL